MICINHFMLQSHIEKRIFCNTYSGCRSSVPIVKTTSKRQHPLRLYDGLESLVESERDYDEVAPLLVQDVDNRQTSMADTPSLEDRSLPPLVTWLQNRRKIENESEVPTEDAEERFWRIILAALTSTINRPLVGSN